MMFNWLPLIVAATRSNEESDQGKDPGVMIFTTRTVREIVASIPEAPEIPDLPSWGGSPDKPRNRAERRAQARNQFRVRRRS
jgi:hypothetical protein